MPYDSNRIALYLSGKLPPHYKAPIDKLYFIEEVRNVFSASSDGKSAEHFPETVFDFIDRQAKTEEQFFSMVLNKAKRISSEKFIELIEDKLKIDVDGRGGDTKDVGDQNKTNLEKTALLERIKHLTKPLLITEGKTDVLILKTAWEKLFWTEIMPFDVIENGIERLDGTSSNWSADGLKNQLNYISAISKDKVVIGLFDNDKEWNEQFKWLDKNTFEPYSVDKDIRKHKTLDIYGFLLPPPEGREDFVHANDIHQRHIEIEHYFSDEVLSKNHMKSQGLLGSDVFDIGNSKDAFSKAVRKLPPGDFESFKPFFERLQFYFPE